MSDESQVVKGGPEDAETPATETEESPALVSSEDPAEPDAAELGLEVPEPDEAPALSQHDAARKDYKTSAAENAAAKQERKYPKPEAEAEAEPESENVSLHQRRAEAEAEDE